MQHARGNPLTNVLGAGVKEQQVQDAVKKSGYPLQINVGDVLRSKPEGDGPKFGVQEEWSFMDRDTRELRNVDLFAELRLHGWDPQPRVRPQLNLLVECKQSELPYVFFRTQHTPHLLGFPTIAGLRSDEISITSDDDPSTWAYNISHALDLDCHPFQTQPTFCHNFSKCVRKGSLLELSGSEPYNALVLPLVKALQHLVQARAPVETALYFDCRLVIGLAVLDAPMIGVAADEGEPALEGLPWVRVLRHEYTQEAERFARDKLWVLDVVHKDYLAPYLGEHLMPFATCFAERALRHTTELASGLAFVPRMGAEGWHPVESRLEPRSMSAKAARAWTIGSRILRLFRGPRRRK